MSRSNESEAQSFLEQIACERFSETYSRFLEGEADPEEVIVSEEAVEIAADM